MNKKESKDRKKRSRRSLKDREEVVALAVGILLFGLETHEGMTRKQAIRAIQRVQKRFPDGKPTQQVEKRPRTKQRRRNS